MQSADESLLIKEAKVFSRYLIGEEADEQSIQLYLSANTKLNITLTDKEVKRLTFLLNNPSFIGMADGALAITDRESGIRKKIYIMFSILESRPAFSSYFLPKESNSPILSLIGSGIRATWNTLIGLILLPWI
jgi:hypothetical protein